MDERGWRRPPSGAARWAIIFTTPRHESPTPILKSRVFSYKVRTVIIPTLCTDLDGEKRSCWTYMHQHHAFTCARCNVTWKRPLIACLRCFIPPAVVRAVPVNIPLAGPGFLQREEQRRPQQQSDAGINTAIKAEGPRQQPPQRGNTHVASAATAAWKGHMALTHLHLLGRTDQRPPATPTESSANSGNNFTLGVCFKKPFNKTTTRV